MNEQQLKLISIVTSSTGTGHDSVAKSLFRALTTHYESTIKAEILTLGAVHDSRLAALSESLYGRVIVDYPWLWELVYNLTDSARCWRLGRWLIGAMSRGVSQELDRSAVILSVHPICTQVVAQRLSRRPDRQLLVALITDLFEAHAAWVAPAVDVYLAPTEEVAASLLAKGVDVRQIRVLGLPLDRRFGCAGIDERLARTEMGLDADCFTILLTGGGEGAGAILAAVRAISDASIPAQLIVACGRNERLRRQLAGFHSGPRMAVLGFEENMARVMACADVVVGKAGALTLSESIALTKPMIVLCSLGGQERRNLQFVSGHHLCASVSDPSGLVATLKRWLVDGSEMAALKANTEVARIPLLNATDQVAGTLVGLVSEGGSLAAAM